MENKFYGYEVWILLDEPDWIFRRAQKDNINQVLSEYNDLMAEFKKASGLYLLAVGILF